MRKSYRDRALRQRAQQQELEQIKQYVRIFQSFAMIAFLVRISTIRTAPLPNVLVWIKWVALIGAILIQLRIYIPMFRARSRKGSDRLIKSGVFKWTRHPMYTLLFIYDFLARVLYQKITPHLVLTTIGFYFLAITACYFHEQEILARFGQEASVYYAKTPRLFFLYPLKQYQFRHGQPGMLQKLKTRLRQLRYRLRNPARATPNRF